MSNIIQKVKDVVHPHKDHTTGTTTTNTTGIGHTTGHTTTGHSTTGHSTTGNNTNTLDGIPSHNNPQSSNYGSHSSNLANKLDPTIDSDRDGRAAAGGVGNTHAGTHTNNPLSSGNTAHIAGGHSGVGSHQAPLGASTHGTHGTTGLTGSGLTGSHGTHGTTGSGLTGTHGTTGSGLTGTHGTHGTTGSGLTGTHGTTGSGLTGTHGTHGTTGHNSNLTSGSSATPGSGNAPNTAGVHDSDVLNKLDPRVDSDLSGGKTYMGNKTFQ